MEYVVCSTCLTIASTGNHHAVCGGENRGVGGRWRNTVNRFGGGAIFLIEVFGVVRVSLVGLKVYGDLKFG